MKKILSFTLVAVMVCLLVISLASCGKEATPIPEGCSKYDNGDIYFGYPENWKETGESVVTLANESGVGNNINIVKEGKTNSFKNYDLDFFNENMKPSYELMGMTVSDASVELTENENGLEILKISYSAEMGGVSMKQIQYITNGSKYTNIITVTIFDDDTALADNVFNTLNISK